MSAIVRILQVPEQEEGPQEIECKMLLTLGRGSQNDLHLPDPAVSRNHALIRRLGDGNYYLVDLGSSNGTFVNGQRVLTPVALTDGQQILLGDSLLEFHRDAETLSSADLRLEAAVESTTVSFAATVHRITVLVTDIRGFTRISTEMDPRRLADLLGQWFARVGETVRNQNGVIDKFIGDAVMVRWLVEARDAERTVLAALRTAAAVHDVCRELQDEFSDLPGPFRAGVGINTGEAVVGTVGSPEAGDYTAVGDSVNLAFALEECTRKIDADVILGPESHALLTGPGWRNLTRSVSVKGCRRHIEVCSLTFEQLDQLLAE